MDIVYVVVTHTAYVGGTTETGGIGTVLVFDEREAALEFVDASSVRCTLCTLPVVTAC